MVAIAPSAKIDPNRPTTQTYGGAVRSVFDTAPDPGVPVAIAPGIWWLRLPLSGALDRLNVYVLEGIDGWTLVDTGNHTAACCAALADAFKGDILGGMPIVNVIATHYHPDHIGLAGWLGERGAVLQTSQACWLHARWLQVDRRDLPSEAEIRFVEGVGMKGMELAAFLRRSPSDYPSLVSPLPESYQRLHEGDNLKIGDRTWTVRLGNGHAAEHITLWADDGFVITGDQILPGISSNLSVHPSEPDADLVAQWLESCHRFARLATPETVCLPGHNLPFVGVPTRCQQMISTQEAALYRLLTHLSRPCTAIDCLNPVYRRPLKSHERLMAIAETWGYLNHLHQQGLIRRELTDDRAYIWYRSSPKLVQ